MSLRFALLDILSGDSMSGYDLTGHFAVSLANVWPAQHSQIYPELAKLVDEGLIIQTGDGPRGRKVYSATSDGVDALRTWLRETRPDYGVRSEFLVRVFCLWVLPTDEALAQLTRDRAEFIRHRDEMAATIGLVDWSENPSRRGSRLAIEFGYRYYSELVGWVDWARDQVERGVLQAGGPLPEIGDLH